MVFSGGVDSKIVQFREITNKVNAYHFCGLCTSTVNHHNKWYSL